ncbi:MAG: EamA family transporter [Lachnospiraceae bacterium]|nr:EamA family transporter [Lachnospiraceae bacterium]
MEKLKMIASMLIVGTIGICVNYISFPSSVIACARAVLGSLFILLVMLCTRKKVQLEEIKKNALYLLLSGTALGFNWIFLFEAYQYTTVAVATLCYYMAPVFVIILSPFVLKERLTPLKILCTMGAVVGAVLISGVVGGEGQDFRGIAFGLLAAVLYCSIIILNKKIENLEALQTTLCQLTVSAVVMVIYVLLTENVTALEFTGTSILLLFIMGIVHTGIVYLMFFSAISKLPAQTSSVLSYVDPVTAIILSALLLHQPMGGLQIIGTVLILGFTLLNELVGSKSQG